MRRVVADEADEHRREAGDEEAQGDRQQHPLEPLSRAELVPGHDAPEAVPQAAATPAPGPVTAAVIRVPDRRRLVDGSAVRHVLARDVRNLSWRPRSGRSRSLAMSGRASRRLGRCSSRAEVTLAIFLQTVSSRRDFFFLDEHVSCGSPFLLVSLSLSLFLVGGTAQCGCTRVFV